MLARHISAKQAQDAMTIRVGKGHEPTNARKRREEPTARQAAIAVWPNVS